MQRFHSVLLVIFTVVTLLMLIFTFSNITEPRAFLKICHSDGNATVDDGKQPLSHRMVDDKVLLKLDYHSKLIERDTNPLELSPKCEREVFLILMVISSPDGFIRRNAIRATWGQSYSRKSHQLNAIQNFHKDENYLLHDTVKTVFLIGWTSKKDIFNLVETEAKVYGDIVVGGLHEDYRNLTMKTRLGLKWAYHHCKAKYILKTDDDVFINPRPLVEWLKVQKRENFYSGWCNFNSPVVREPNSKWYISFEDFAGSNYPGYCLGGGYVMSDDVLGRILAISYGRKLFPMEDLYVGLMVKDLGDVDPIDNKESFNLIFDGVQGCKYNTLYLAHPVNPNDQLKMHLEAELAQTNCK